MTIPSRFANAFRTRLNDFMIIITSQVTTCSWYQIDANKRSWITWLVNNLKKPFHCHGITAETVLAHMSWIASFCSSWMATRSVCIASTNIYFQIVRVYGMNHTVWTDLLENEPKFAFVTIITVVTFTSISICSADLPIWRPFTTSVWFSK